LFCFVFFVVVDKIIYQLPNGNVNELQNIGEGPRKSSLFFLTVLKLYGVTTLESDQPEIGLNGWKSTLSLEVSGVSSTILEN